MFSLLTIYKSRYIYYFPFNFVVERLMLSHTFISAVTSSISFFLKILFHKIMHGSQCALYKFLLFK